MEDKTIAEELQEIKEDMKSIENNIKELIEQMKKYYIQNNEHSN